MRKLILATVLGLGLVVTANADTVCKVTKSVPTYKTINVRTPHTESYQKVVNQRVQCGYSYKEQDRSSLGWDTAIGAIAGGFLGSQVGRGNGELLRPKGRSF